MMLRSPIPPERTSSRSPAPPRPSFDDELERPGSSGSDASSVASNVTTVSAIQSSLNDFGAAPDASSPRIPRTSSTNGSGATDDNPRRPSASSLMPQNEMTSRKTSGRVVPPDLSRHRPRHHSQGFFEPSLPTASLSDVTLSASRIAAQTAMQQQSSTAQHPPKRLPTNIQGPDGRGGSISPPPPPPQQVLAAPGSGTTSGQSYQNGIVGGNALAATTAANVVFPRGPALQPGMPGDQAQPEREQKQKGDKPKMKLFSKPKHIGISRDKDSYGKDKGIPSPSKMGFPGSSGLSRIVSGSTDTLPSNNSSMYSLSNASVSTVVPADRQTSSEKDKDKDKDKAHKHHFLSRQKLKLKDRDDHYNLPLSSASSNSKPSDPNAPQSLYSFTPASPNAGSTTFSKTVGGLDLLHGGRALREKKKEEKLREEIEQDLVVSGATPAVFSGPSSLGNSTGLLPEAALRETLSGFGLHNMTPDDAWDFLKAKLLVIFDGEDVRIAIEDLNKLVLIHIQRCVQKRTPTAIVDDLRELLETGCASLNHTLNGVPDEKLVPHLVQIWLLVFGTILPFIQAVFLPLDLEFRGAGSVMNLREAKDFWNSVPTGKDFENELEVRHLVLVAFRDMVILKRYEGLKATFSRLSLDSINVGSTALSITTKSSNNSGRPATAASLDAGFGSYNSQSSTLLNAAGSYSSDSMSNRSRAASNTSSNPDQLIFQSFSSPNQRATVIHRASHTADTSQLITETVGRMLQCLSVLASVQTGDEAQEKIETLSKALKHNWLGRGRTGRDRRGFVGAKIRPSITTHTNSDESTNDPRNGDLGWQMHDGRQQVSVL
ncbi:hypothetical protein ALT_3162 [Aspergillus lentulus]|uniref:Target of rapamycin complex 2 subunit bit61 n=1 Tax=Aspergillus lentulus TaxID=293939 RepID=A0AAN4T9E6_ASPLE|nr:uncharacterized protein IFM58399_07384 [Aspergillus lentulus]KAF4161588.1 hypothetical protein CNMCM6069_003494 [Aspergillus lentulus]GAQ05841.1 hypothetical protein ALT_3162 [Aspergillus lentulus]GFF44789.1 hypothetical protein IFM58399_07384 [Aspergillus lentulus]GFF69033.1 hypothetical protein IFM62136_07474 [Aspergillus lentulus]GFF78595.1 hypothetical protein IFM47457_04703 [Aspergillus lentulus]